MRTLRESEALIRVASAQLDRMVILDRAGLMTIEGNSMLNGWSVRIAQVAGPLFDVSVARTDTSVALLRTTVHRPDSLNADR